MNERVRHCSWHIFLSVLTLFVGLIEHVNAREVTLSSLITYEIKEGLYVDKGADDGLQQGLLGFMRLEDGSIFEFEVLHVTRKTSLLRIFNISDDINTLVSQSVELNFEQNLPDQDNMEEGSESFTETNDETFIPLLWPPDWSVGQPELNNIFHGQINIRQMLQKDNMNSMDYSITRLGSSGSLDRIEGSKWSFEWSGNLSYRDGQAYSFSSDYQEVRFDLYMASFQHSIGEEGLFRFGRFLPRELPGIGYIDGILIQDNLSEHWSLGAVTGFKPDRYNLSPSMDEPLIAAYGIYEVGDRKSLHYSGTAGILSSLYNNKTDRLALLFDQRLYTGSSLSVYSTTQVDFDVGSAEFQTGTRLTRFDLSAIYKVSPRLTFRTGLDHWERPDNQAERDLLEVEYDRLFDNGYWRYWIGSDQELFWNLRLSEQVAFIESSEYDYAPRWTLGLTRTGLLSLPDASMTATIYNLESQNLNGYGARLSASLPLLKHKLFVQSVAGFSLLEAQTQSEDFASNYISLRLNGNLSSNLALFGGFTHSYGDNIDSNLVDFGLRFSW